MDNLYLYLKWLAFILVIIGAVNLGLIGAFNYNLITNIIHQDTVVRVIYILIGLAGLFLIYWVATVKKL